MRFTEGCCMAQGILENMNKNPGIIIIIIIIKSLFIEDNI